MGTYGNDRKDKQLNMPYGTANNKLRKMIMFQLIQKLNMDYCFRCKGKIENIDDLSVEHMVPWLDSDNPSKLFFDLDNIAFSHLNCNVGAVRKEYKADRWKKLALINTIPAPEGTRRCYKCKQFKPVSEFNKNKNKNRGIQSYCKTCQNK